ncbi:LytR/AlgR family response regulator transcription factor [Sediminicola arcticus]|jgi:DNA-binding LytR/AlgR family response regulator|uniref:Response regulator n=1 Tax=Sediminicola arcticus TaxID=1574308 RepID=A0ABV2SQQ5_9FLAO
MGEVIKILIVEDEMLIAANISLQLQNLGYEIGGIFPRGEEALAHLKEHRADIVLLDIQLKGTLDGIETAEKIKELYNLAIIFLTANTDDLHFRRAKNTHPHAFISKPFKKLDLQHAIELTASNHLQPMRPNNSLPKAANSPIMLEDRIFVRHNDKMVKIIIKDIQYIEAERNYSRIYCCNKSFLLVITLKEMDKKLPQEHFIRIHRSFVINLSQVDEVANTHVVISKKAVPLSKTYRKNLMERLQTI